MPQFATPAFLLLTLAVPLLLGWWLRLRRGAVRHPAVGLFEGLPGGRARLARLGGAGLRGLALLLLAVALAGPRWPDGRTRLEAEGIAIVVVVDVSGSMAEPDFDWNGEPIGRLEAVKRVFRLFVAGGTAEALDGGDKTTFEGRRTDLIGLVTFGTRPEPACPLTLSHSALLRYLDAERPRSLPGESETNVTDAVAVGLDLLVKAERQHKVLVVLSDGEHNVAAPPSRWTTRQAGQVAVSLQVPIYAIDASGSKAGPEGAPAEAPSPGAEPPPSGGQTLQELAHISRGRYFAARDTARLLEACRAIDRLERVATPSFQYRRYHEGYPWFALAAFVLFCAALALDLTVWRRLP